MVLVSHGTFAPAHQPSQHTSLLYLEPYERSFVGIPGQNSRACHGPSPVLSYYNNQYYLLKVAIYIFDIVVHSIGYVFIVLADRVYFELKCQLNVSDKLVEV